MRENATAELWCRMRGYPVVIRVSAADRLALLEVLQDLTRDLSRIGASCGGRPPTRGNER